MDKLTKIGSGAFGSIFRAKTLQISSSRVKDKNKFAFFFERKSFAIKRLTENSGEYESKGYRV